MFSLRILSLSAAFVLAAAPTFAVPLPNGAVIAPTGTSFAADNELGAVVENDELLEFRLDPTPLTPLMDVGGQVQNRVARSNILDTLIFAPRIRDTFNIDGGTFGIIGFRLDGYEGWDLDVDFRTDGLGDKGFTSVSRSLSGDLLTFRYGDPLFIDAIAPGAQDESLFPSIKTNAPKFAKTGTMKIFGQLFDTSTEIARPFDEVFTVTIEGIAVPVSAVPLPAGAYFLLGGLLALWGVRRRPSTC